MTFNLTHRRLYPWLFVVGCGVLLPLVFLPQFPADKRFEAVVAVVGSVGALTHFFYSRHLEETRLFRELFTDFNARYNALNDQLNEIRMRPKPIELTPTDERTLYDYFNLCAEEFLFFRARYIHPEVWQAWCRGMVIFDDIPAIHDLWERELLTNSYYGFSLAIARNA